MKKYGFLLLLWRGFYETAFPVSGFYALSIAIASLSGGISTFTVTPFRLGICGAVIIGRFCFWSCSVDGLWAWQGVFAACMRRDGAKFRHAITRYLSPRPLSQFCRGHGCVVFITDTDGFEVQIGIGQVTTIQENGLTQVALTAPIPGYEETVKKLANNEQGALASITSRK
jgi:hypothetical protein